MFDFFNKNCKGKEKEIENKSIIQTELETYQPIAMYLKSKFKQANF